MWCGVGNGVVDCGGRFVRSLKWFEANVHSITSILVSTARPHDILQLLDSCTIKGGVKQEGIIGIG